MSNLNPIYLIEKAFLSGETVNATEKMIKNGVKKHGTLKTIKRNLEALYKRGQHKVKEVEKQHPEKYRSWSTSFSLADAKDSKSRKAVSSIGKSARKDKKLSSKQIDSIVKGV